MIVVVLTRWFGAHTPDPISTIAGGGVSRSKVISEKIRRKLPGALFFVHGFVWARSVFRVPRSKSENDDEDDCRAKHHGPQLV